MEMISLVPGCADIFLKLEKKEKGSSFKLLGLGISVVSEKGFVWIWLGRFLRVARKRHLIITDGMRGKRGICSFTVYGSTQSPVFLLRFLNARKCLIFASGQHICSR